MIISGLGKGYRSKTKDKSVHSQYVQTPPLAKPKLKKKKNFFLMTTHLKGVKR